jgi:hypothetical protein
MEGSSYANRFAGGTKHVGTNEGSSLSSDSFPPDSGGRSAASALLNAGSSCSTAQIQYFRLRPVS